MCYADDTLIISSSTRLFDAIMKANIQTARVVRHIRELGLLVAEAKTEAVLFCRRKPAVMPVVRVGSADILVGNSMRYLGVMIDGSWNFRSHFKYVESKASKVVRSLSRLMPNLRGPGERKRQLFASVLTSVVMYAAPVWGEIFAFAPDRITRPLRRLQRSIAIRVIASYRTVSYDAATVLARIPPWSLEATMRCRIYSRFADLKLRSEFSHKTEAEVRNGESLLLFRQWDTFLSRPGIWGQKTVTAVQPFLRRWINRDFGEINYHVAQMLTGHGSFGHFLWRIGKRETAECFHCSSQDDTVEHTIADCPAWDNLRWELIHKFCMGNVNRLTLSQIISKILEKKEYWSFFVSFAVSVIRIKEEDHH